MSIKILTIKEIQNIVEGISASKASRQMKLLRDVLNKPKPMILTVDEYCNYFGIELK